MNEEAQRPWAKIVAEAWADAEYKARLLADPAAVLQEAGVELPSGVTLRAVENTGTVMHLVLPACPGDSGGVEEGEVRSSAGIEPPPHDEWFLYCY